MRYHKRCNGTLVPDYACQREGIATGTPVCQNVCGAGVDTAVTELILDRLTPLALEVALTVTDEITAQAEHADRIRATHVQRAQHTADLARRRYLAVDPSNRLVADHLEADYNTALRELASATDDYDTAKNPRRAPPRRRPAQPDTLTGRRFPGPVERPGHPHSGTQAPDPAARHRRHPRSRPASTSRSPSASPADSTTPRRCPAR